MNKKILTFAARCVVLATLTLTSASGVAAEYARAAKGLTASDEYTDRLIVRLKDEPAGEKRQVMAQMRARSLSAAAGTLLEPVRAAGGQTQIVRLTHAMPLAEVRRIAARLMTEGSVLYAEPDRRKYPQRVPNDSGYNQQWYLFETIGGINAPAAWDVTVGSSSIVVAVIDTGVIGSNADLQGRLLPGYDFVSADPVSGCVGAACPFATANDGNGRDSDPTDPGDWIDASDKMNPLFSGAECIIDDSTWHGTLITGVIGAATNNGQGMAGVDWAARILPVRVLGKCGGYTSDILDGARWAAGLAVPGVPNNPTPANVLNISLGGIGACSVLEQNTVNEVLATGNVKAIVTSAGNEGQDTANNSPGNCSGVINVGATDRNGNQPAYSNFGPLVTLSAPGGFITSSSDAGNGILSLYNNGLKSPTSDAFAFFSGTSATAPQVAGAVSLMLAANPTLSAAQVRNILIATARAFPSGSNCSTSRCGAGILNVNAAVRQAAATPTTTPAPADTTSSSGGGGGCTTGSGAADSTLLLLALTALLGLARHRRS